MSPYSDKDADFSNEENEGYELTEKQIKYLKIANIVMGLLIVAGVLALFIGLIMKAGELAKKKKPDSIVPLAQTQENQNLAPAIDVQIGTTASVESVKRTGNSLQIIAEDKNKTVVYFIDLTSGKTITQVNIVRKKQ